MGALLVGKYRVERVLGQGGMGIVVAALHVHLNQRVALKFLLPEMLQNRDVVERFLREARASAQLRGEHVCRVSDVGTLETGAPYIVMELLDGSDLASVLATRGALPVPLAVDYVLQACLGIAEAHALGVVHRDLKPANLFLTCRPDGAPLIKVLDFGIAKAQRDMSLQLTRTTAILGSPGYMSPEQLRASRDCDARSDIWALGVILYELVGGRLPFNGDSITELALHIAMDPTPPLVAPSLPPGFEAIVQRCLAKDAAHRFPELASLAHALAPFGGPHARELAAGVARLLHVSPALSAPAASNAFAASGAQAASGSTTLGAATGAVSTAPARKSHRGMLGGLVLVAAAGIAIAVAVTRNHAPSDRVQPARAATSAPAAPAATGEPGSTSASESRSAPGSTGASTTSSVSTTPSAPAAPSTPAPSAVAPAAKRAPKPEQPVVNPRGRRSRPAAATRAEPTKPDEDIGNDRL